jgi:hypothetical protein
MDLFVALHFVIFLQSLSLLIHPLYFMIIDIHFNFQKILIIVGQSLLLQINSKMRLLEVTSVSLEVSNHYFKLLHFRKVNLYYLHLVEEHYFDSDFELDLFLSQYLQKDFIIN